MIAEEGEFTVENVLRSMGDLSNERVIAKHAARHSLVRYSLSKPVLQSLLKTDLQALSTTRAVRLDVKITRGWPDIYRNG